MTLCKDLEYKRYTFEMYKTAVEPQIAAIRSAASADEITLAREKIIEADGRFSTMSALANARYTLDTRNEFYVAEVEYYDSVTPLRDDLFAQYCKALMESKLGRAAADGISPALSLSFENHIKANSPLIIEDRQKEAAVVMEYSKLMSTMQFEFDGKTLPLSVVRGYLSDNDRAVRRKAAFSIGEGLYKHRELLDDIFDRLVKIRHGMAKKLGLKNYIPLGYYNMDRKDFGEKEIRKFREGVLDSIVPVVSELKEMLRRELGIEKITFYDDSLTLTNGETKPKLSESEMFEAAQKMYDEIDGEIGDFMRFMINSGAFDVRARDGKWGGGYCTEFHDYRQPFILANWNGSCDDVDVLTHEFGHAFAGMNAMRHGIYELNVGGMETAECHSMSMELLCHPYMDKFFFKDADRYRYRHLLKCLDFIPYGVVVDEFQHIIYENPDLTPKQRNGVFKELSKKYMPHMTYDGIPYLEDGTRWQFQMHIYETPFYYIDYCLAQTVALEFYAQSLKDYSAALKNYVGFVKKGGSKTLSDLVASAGLSSPFRTDTLKNVATVCERRLKELKNKIDGSREAME